MQDVIFSPSEFVAVLNQTLEFAYPVVTIEGELSNFRISKNRWVYFDLKDEESVVSFFGSIFQLPGPLEDGLRVQVIGSPRLHHKFGFSVTFRSITPVGEGALKKAADLLRQKLEKEGLFAPERKRLLPTIPRIIGLITAVGSAAQADFLKILDQRWGGVEILLVDSLVQGELAPTQLIAAINKLNSIVKIPEVIVITRGGGSAEDLAAFNDERLVRAIASSRIPTLVAIGHEVDISLAELAADLRASTPSNAAELLTPDRAEELRNLQNLHYRLDRAALGLYDERLILLKEQRRQLKQFLRSLIDSYSQDLIGWRRLAETLNPQTVLNRGYAIISKQGHNISSIKSVKVNDQLAIKFRDGRMISIVKKIMAES